MRYAEITGWGKCVPPAVLTNSDLERVTDTSDEWITSRTGIKERRISHVPTSDLAAVAGKRALAAAGLSADQLQLVILATCTPDTLLPSGSSVVQDKLGATDAGALDLNAACSGFMYALAVGAQMIRAGAHDAVLVIGAERLSYWVNYTDRSTAVLFGDGAGAVVLQASQDPVGPLSFELGSDGSAAEILHVPASGTNHDRASAFIEREGFAVIMDGPEVFRRAVTAMGDASVAAVADAGLVLDDIDLLIPHQANVRIIDATARRLRLDPAQVFVNIASYGNTSAATIPIALTEALESGRIRPGANLVFAAFGGGLSWGASVVKWGERSTPLGRSDAGLPPNDKTALEILEPNFRFFSSTSD